MDVRNIMISLQAVFVVVGNLQAIPVHGTGQADDMVASKTMVQETEFAPILHSFNDVVVVLTPKKPTSTNAVLRGKRFEWLGEMDSPVTSENEKNVRFYHLHF